MLGQPDHAQVGRDHHGPVPQLLLTERSRTKFPGEQRHCRQHLHLDSADGLQRDRVRIDHDQAPRPDRSKRFGDNANPDGLSGPATTVLPGIPEVRRDRGDPYRTCSPAGIEQQQQLHHMLGDRRTRGLGQVGVRAPQSIHGGPKLTVREPLHRHWGRLVAQNPGGGIG